MRVCVCVVCIESITICIFFCTSGHFNRAEQGLGFPIVNRLQGTIVNPNNANHWHTHWCVCVFVVVCVCASYDRVNDCLVLFWDFEESGVTGVCMYTGHHALFPS